MLTSQLFRGNQALQAALVNDASHITIGSRGEHVRLIQRALTHLGDRSISGAEYAKATYGPTTAGAVLRFKTDRKIINTAYQKSADNIVGKMTVQALDTEMARFEIMPAA